MEHKFGYLPERRDHIIDTIRERHIVIFPTNDLPTDSRDPDDNNVLQAALFINADFLITGDRDLLDLERVNTVRRQLKVDKRGENGKRQFSKLFHLNHLSNVQIGQIIPV